jgi:GT2 family glycosyltransferase
LNKEYELDVFLVDDGSTDGTADEVSSAFPQINIIQGNGQLYWNRGMYQAWQIAAKTKNYDFYFWLNDDAELFSNAISELLECFNLAGTKSIICGATCSKLNNKFTYGGSTLAGDPIIPNGQMQKCDIMHGNCVLINSAVFSDVGFIDPLFIHSIGDFDYGFRAIKKGFKIFTTRCFIAYCERNEKLPKWCLSEIPFIERLKSLYSPLGNSHPYYFFVYEKRHFGVMVAIKHFFSIHLRMLIPSLWK